jgi:hypothetical protein
MPSRAGLLATQHDTFLALVKLFREAGEAHHRAFLATNGYDPEWPRWYAQHLAPRMEVLLGRPLHVPDLAIHLRTIEDRRKSTIPQANWPCFYAAALLEADDSSAP